jgi:hypothetical protein
MFGGSEILVMLKHDDKYGGNLILEINTKLENHV